MFKNKVCKIICFVLLAVVLLFSIFIAEESIRLKSNDEALPLIITDQTKYCVSCIQEGEEINMEYYSIGYKVNVRYMMSEESSDDNRIILVIGKEFRLFNKFMLWGWIS